MLRNWRLIKWLWPRSKPTPSEEIRLRVIDTLREKPWITSISQLRKEINRGYGAHHSHRTIKIAWDKYKYELLAEKEKYGGQTVEKV